MLKPSPTQLCCSWERPHFILRYASEGEMTSLGPCFVAPAARGCVMARAAALGTAHFPEVR